MATRIKKAGRSINYDRTILECNGRYFVWADWTKLEEVEPKYQEIELGWRGPNGTGSWEIWKGMDWALKQRIDPKDFGETETRVYTYLKHKYDWKELGQEAIIMNEKRKLYNIR